MRKRTERIWISWEHHRRSEELARRLNCRLIVHTAVGPLRYPSVIAATIRTLVQHRPRILFVQNPSMVLATLGVLWGLAAGSRVVVDRHTTFALNRPRRLTLEMVVFRLLNRITLRAADLTIVTNERLAQLVREAAGVPFVLPDPIPDITPSTRPELRAGHNVLFICSYGEDEPIQAVLDAARALGPGVHLYLTGNPHRADTDWTAEAPGNVIFTGYLQAQEFVDYLFAADSVMVLTTSDHTMLCGCYEALAAGKPLITSDKTVLRDYFSAAIFVEPNADSIAQGIREVVARTGALTDDIRALSSVVEADWNETFQTLERTLGGPR